MSTGRAWEGAKGEEGRRERAMPGVRGSCLGAGYRQILGLFSGRHTGGWVGLFKNLPRRRCTAYACENGSGSMNHS
jgi:hypothetical protein